MANLNIDWNKETNTRIVEGKSLVFHCHHYNCFLQKTIEGPEDVDGKSILTDAARGTAYEHFTTAFSNHADLATPEQKLGFASEFFRIAGFGLVDFSNAGEEGGVVKCPTSHYARGWLSKWGARKTPCCYFNTGWIEGVMAASYRKGKDHYKAEETRCEAVDGKGCEYKVKVR